MSFSVLRVGYTQYVLESRKALQILELIMEAEIYELKYRSEEPSTHHIYSQDETDSRPTMELLSSTQYNMYKLAGKPEK